MLLIEELLDEVLGLGPLEPLLKDPTITDILVNTHRQVFVERHGVLEATSVRFQDERHLLQHHRPHRLRGRPPGRRVRSPGWTRASRTARASTRSFRRARWTEPLLSIRKFSRDPLTIERLIANGALTREMADPAQRHRRRRASTY